MLMINYTAIDKGEKAKACLEEALEALNSASNWGLLDIFGGGMFTTFVKHSRIERAKDYIYQSREYMWEFKRELGGMENINIDIGSFLTFADFFWDGLFADILVQSKINDAKRRISSAISDLDRVLSRLRLV